MSVLRAHNVTICLLFWKMRPCSSGWTQVSAPRTTSLLSPAKGFQSEQSPQTCGFTFIVCRRGKKSLQSSCHATAHDLLRTTKWMTTLLATYTFPVTFDRKLEVTIVQAAPKNAIKSRPVRHKPSRSIQKASLFLGLLERTEFPFYPKISLGWWFRFSDYDARQGFQSRDKEEQRLTTCDSLQQAEIPAQDEFVEVYSVLPTKHYHGVEGSCC